MMVQFLQNVTGLSEHTSAFLVFSAIFSFGVFLATFIVGAGVVAGAYAMEVMDRRM